MSLRQRRFAQRLLCVAALAAAVPAWAAGSWTFAADGPLTLGGLLSGSFSGNDSNANGTLERSEVSSFVAAYTGAPPATSSFAITAIGLADSFGFELGSNSLSFDVTDGLNRNISGGSFALSSVVGIDFVDAGGTLAVTAVPEPGPVAMMLSGLGLFATWRRVRRTGKAKSLR